MTEKVSPTAVLIGTIDQSTTGTKFVVFNSTGELIEKEIIPHEQITPSPGWLEHDAEEILANIHLAISKTLSRLATKGYQLSQLKTIGITNQRETVLAWNKHTGKPYHNAIVWSDTRTQDVCKRWVEKHNNNPATFAKITGLPINTYFSAFKIQWLLENVPAIRDQLATNVIFGTMDSWVIWNLTNKLHLTDVTNASRTFLLNINTLEYDQQILEELGLTKDHLPRVLSSAQRFGVISNGELTGIPIEACLGDQQAASLGHGLFDVGGSKITYGTGCFFLVNIGETPAFQENCGLLTTILFKLGENQPTCYAFEGAIEAGGATINWARDHLGLFSSYDDLAAKVASTESSGGVIFVPSLSGIFSPYWREDATGSILGLTLFSKKEHVLRALLEGIACRTKDVVDIVESTTDCKIDSLKVDGGLTNSAFLMQFQSDILSKKVLLTSVAESTCLGVAFAAGLTAGIYKSVEDIKSCIQSEREVLPHTSDNEKDLVKDHYAKWKNAVLKTLL